jgi:hypothetical protein
MFFAQTCGIEGEAMHVGSKQSSVDFDDFGFKFGPSFFG